MHDPRDIKTQIRSGCYHSSSPGMTSATPTPNIVLCIILLNRIILGGIICVSGILAEICIQVFD